MSHRCTCKDFCAVGYTAAAGKTFVPASEGGLPSLFVKNDQASQELGFGDHLRYKRLTLHIRHG